MYLTSFIKSLFYFYTYIIAIEVYKLGDLIFYYYQSVPDSSTEILELIGRPLGGIAISITFLLIAVRYFYNKEKEKDKEATNARKQLVFLKDSIIESKTKEIENLENLISSKEEIIELLNNKVSELNKNIEYLKNYNKIK